jgi:membrane fusion protein (multidrug efflux system)
MQRSVLAITLAASLISACRQATESSVASPERVPVETVTITVEDIDVTVDAVGTLEAHQVVELRPKRAGRVRELRLTEGVHVQAGEVLIELADDELQAQLEVAKASVVDATVRERNARQQYERAATLHRKGVASQQEHDDARAELDRAAAGLGLAQANLAFAEAQLAETVLRAPFDGIVGRRRVDLGAFARQGAALVTLVDPDPIEIVFAVPERYLGQIQLEQAVEMSVVSHPQRLFPGTVTFIDPQVDPINRTVTIKAVVQNPDFLLRPGQFATVQLHLDRHVGMPVVPEEALVPDGSRNLVFVIENGSAASRVVETGVRLPGRVEILDGVRAGERVVRTGHEKLKVDLVVPVIDVGEKLEG